MTNPFHNWNKGGTCTECGCSYAGFERRDPCPGKSTAPAELSMGRKFAVGDRVRKRSGSWWEGRIVGFYSTEQTPIGYNVQLDTVLNGPVQIYPETALTLSPTADTQNPLPSTNGEIGETNHAPAQLSMGSDAREIITRFLAEQAAGSPMSGGLKAGDYMGLGGVHEQADELLKRLSVISASEVEG